MKPLTVEILLAHARDPRDPATLAFAGLIAIRARKCVLGEVPIIGMQPREFLLLLERRFPGMDPGPWQTDRAHASRPARGRARESEDLLELLLDHSPCEDGDGEWLALAVATGCMGENHLWQDLGLPSRQVLSSLLAEAFPTLFTKNVGDMKWKKFFYKQLCERAGLAMCRAPSCGACRDHGACFGPEEAAKCPASPTAGPFPVSQSHAATVEETSAAGATNGAGG